MTTREWSPDPLSAALLDRLGGMVLVAGPGGEIRYVNGAAADGLGYTREQLCGMRLREVAPCLEPWCRLNALPPYRFECDFIDASGDSLWLSVRPGAMQHEGLPYLLLTAERAHPPGSACLTATADLTQVPAALLHAQAEGFRAVVENSPDVIARYDGEGRRLFLNPAMARLFTCPADDALGRTILDDSPLTATQAREYAAMIRDVFNTGVEFQGELLFQAAAGGPARWGHLRVVPEFGRDGKVVSVLAVGREITGLKKAEFELQQSRAELRELAVRRETTREEERKRLAREMHDELGQLLMALRLEITLAARQQAANAPVQQGLDNMMEVLDRTSQVVRGIVTDLRPVALDLGIVSALEWLASDFEARTGVRCDLCVGEGELDPGEQRAVTLFRIAQESLTNVARHAGASRVTIALGRRNGEYRLMVRDDGRGFDTQTRQRDSFGLIGIHERALALNGRATVHSAPGEGTVVEVVVPE